MAKNSFTHSTVSPLEIKETRKPRGQKGEIDPSQFLPRVESHWKVGAYVSAAGGVENAVTNAASIG